MPHLTVECSENLKTKINTESLLKTLHNSVKQCAGVDIERVKSRLVVHHQVLKGKDARETQMIHVTLALLSGRDEKSRKEYASILMNTLQSLIPKELSPSLSVEVREMDQETYLKN